MWCYLGKLTLRLLQYSVTLLVWPYSKLYSWVRPRRSVPPISNPLLLHSATALAKLIRERQVKCVDVIQAYIERIKEVDRIINSVVDQRFNDALEEARQIDARLDSGADAAKLATERPLLGVPITVKECLAVAGMSQNGGRALPRSRKAVSDCDAVVRLRAAGAVVLAVTNTPELCLFWESYNNAHGVTCNPYDTARSAGGSSGGECALIAAGGSVIGVGSDIVGSGRVPALFCGVFGHKPTPRVISVDGHLPVSDDPDWSTFLVVSPLCRYAEDLPLVMSCAAPLPALRPLRLHAEVDIKKIRIFYMEEHNSVLNHAVNRDIKKAIRKAAQHFQKQHSIEIQRIELEELNDTLEAASSLMLRMKSPLNIMQKSDDPEDWGFKDVFKQLMKRLLGLSPHTLYAILYCLLKRLADLLSQHRINEYRHFKHAWQRKFKDMLGEDGVLILPVFPHQAGLHYQMYYKLTNVNYLSAFNMLEMPATAVPIGLDSRNVPVAIQVVAWKDQDRLTFAVARELEAAFGGWTPPGDTLNV